MRRTQFLRLLPALLVLFGISRAAAGTTLTVAPGCYNNGAGSVACSPLVLGGTGTYVSYHWQYTETYRFHSTISYSWTSTEPWLQRSCRIDAAVTVTLTVTDSEGGTGSRTQRIVCSEYGD